MVANTTNAIKSNLPKDNPKRKYRIILKDNDNRAVLREVSSYASVSSSALSQLKKDYEKLLADETKYQQENS